MSSFECFGQRLLNPYRGVVHTVRQGSAEAVSVDGRHWDIYVSNESLLAGLGQDPVQVRRARISDIRYGHWSSETGLKRGSLYPSEDFRRMEAMGARVYEQLLRVHDSVPFPLADDFELWLLDAAGWPLALLASTLAEEDMDLDIAPEWHAGHAALEGFEHDLRGLPSAGGRPAAYLGRYINALAGARPSAQWFLRAPDGGGLGLEGVRLAAELRGRDLEAHAFPAFFLGREGHDAEHLRLIDAFHGWQAPWLLQLPGIDAASRAALERAARAQPQEVLARHRLYPEVVDRAQLSAALVEAMMSRAAPAPVEAPLSPQYIELDPSGERGMP